MTLSLEDWSETVWKVGDMLGSGGTNRRMNGVMADACGFVHFGVNNVKCQKRKVFELKPKDTSGIFRKSIVTWL